jgi:hypothetical protein
MRYSNRQRQGGGWDAGKALAIRLNRVRQDPRFQAGLAAMQRRADAVLTCGLPLDSAEFVAYVQELGGFQRILTDAFEAEVGGAVEAHAVTGAIWGQIPLKDALRPGEWLEIKNLALQRQRSAS